MRDIVASAVVTACLIAGSGTLAPAYSFGAIAVGLTANGVVRDGVAIGTTWNYATEEGARNRALSECRASRAAPRAARQCKVVGTFGANQCVAVSMDPQAGTPGIGWAIAPDKAGAESQAVANCKTTAGADRAEFCVVSESKCEGD
jgi:hypothetical protein